MPTSSRLQVLIVEDQPADAELVMDELRQAGFAPEWQRVDTKDSFLQSLDSAPDLIIADYNLPSFTGLEALALLRERGLDVPFILVSGSIGEEQAVAAIRDGASDYLIKDRLARLGSAVEHALQMKELRAEQRRAEAAIHASEVRFRALVEHSSDAVLLVGPHGVINYASPANNRILGYGPGERIDYNILELIHPDNRAEAMILFGELTPLPGKTVSLQFQLQHKDGSWRWVEGVVTNLIDELNVKSLVINYRDVTERREASGALERERSLLQTLIDNVPDAIYFKDRDGRILINNHQDRRNHGVNTLDQSVGKTDFDFLPRDLAEQFFAAEQEVMATGQPIVDVEEIDYDPQGNLRWHLSTKVPLRNANEQVTGLVGITRDITKRKRAEESEREQRRLAEALRDSLAALTSSLDVDSVLQQILHYAATVVPSEAGSIILFEDNYGKFAYLRGYSPEAEKVLKGYRFSIQSGKYAIVRSESKPSVVADTQSMPDRSPFPGTEWIRSAISIPIQIHDEVIGLLFVGSATPNHFRQEDVDHLQAFARYAALALENAYHFKELERKVAERTADLQAAKEQVEAILNSSLDGILLAHADLRMQQTNFAFNRLFGYQAGEYPDGSILALLHPTDANRVRAAIKTVIEEQTGRLIEARVCRKDGRVFEAELSIGPGNIRAGDIKDTKDTENFVCTVRDITERKHAQDRLAEERNLLRTLIDALPDYVYVKDTNHRTVLSNVARARSFGLTPEETIGKDDFAFVPADLVEQFHADEDKLFESGQPLIALEERTIKEGGTTIWASTTKVLLRNLRGEIIGLVGITRDITEQKERERQLRYHASLQESVSDAVIATDLDFRIQSWNRAAETIYGWRAEEVIGKVAGEILQTVFESPQKQERVLQSFLDQGYWRDEYIQHRKDSVEVHILGATTLLKGEHGVPFGIVSVNHDITERIRTQQALEASEQRFKLLVNGVRDYAIFMLERDGKVASWNPGAEAIKGYTADEIIGQHINRFYTPDDNARGEPQHVLKIAETSGRYVGEGWRVRKDGTLFWASVVITSLRDTGGQLIGFSKVTRDLTEQKRAEAALRDSEEKYRRLIETMRGGLAIYDENDMITYVNERFCEMLGYSRDELIGSSSFDYVDDASVAHIDTHLQRRRLSESTSYEIVAKRKQGRPVYLLVSGSPLFDKSGAYTGSFAVTTDITVQKEAEDTLRQALQKEKELNELKSRFVSMASHEFRTPLATILALTETLSVYRHKLSDDQIEQRFGKIKEQVAHLKDIMEDVLHLARMQARRGEFNPVLLDLDALCRSVLDEFQSRPEVAQHIEYNCDLPLREVKLDKKLMRQAINNLVSNAVKYSPDGKSIAVTLDYTGAAIRLQVRDEGIGIPEADIEHLFEPFHRATNVGAISGTGLGLVITKESIELHGGTITVESQIGVGTTFTVSIPVAMRKNHNDDKNTGD